MDEVTELELTDALRQLAMPLKTWTESNIENPNEITVDVTIHDLFRDDGKPLTLRVVRPANGYSLGEIRARIVQATVNARMRLNELKAP